MYTRERTVNRDTLDANSSATFSSASRLTTDESSWMYHWSSAKRTRFSKAATAAAIENAPKRRRLSRAAPPPPLKLLSRSSSIFSDSPPECSLLAKLMFFSICSATVSGGVDSTQQNCETAVLALSRCSRTRPAAAAPGTLARRCMQAAGGTRRLKPREFGTSTCPNHD